jgi:hypothetical protein
VRHLASLTLALLSVAACASIPLLPMAGGPRWVELTSAHFVMCTDAAPDRAKVLVREMEHVRSVLLGVALDKDVATDKVFVIALRNESELKAFLDEHFSATTWAVASPAKLPTIVMVVDTADDQHVIAHELTHVVTSTTMPKQPHWFAEGIAGYYGTTRINLRKGTVEIGEPLDDMVDVMQRELRPVRYLFACRSKRCMDNMFYASTWALFSYLVNVHPDELRTYEHILATLPQGQRAPTWLDVFPNKSLDRELALWLGGGELAIHHYKLSLRDWPITQETLSDSNVLAARGLLRRLLRHEPPVEVKQALEMDHTNVLGWLVTAWLDDAIAPDDARATAAAHPKDWRAWWLVWFATKQGPEAQAARDELCRLTKGTSSSPTELCGSPIAVRPR